MIEDALKDAYRGWPLIFYAVDAGKLDVFRVLLELGTSPNVICRPGLPILAYSILHHDNRLKVEMVKILLSKGADPRAIPEVAIKDAKGVDWSELFGLAIGSPQDLSDWWMKAPKSWFYQLKHKLDNQTRCV